MAEIKNILITGGSGLIGTNLSKLLKEEGYNIAHLTRSKRENYPYQQFEWDINQGVLDQEAIIFADAIIHLAGSGVADKRWTAKRKKDILRSRTESTKILYKYLSKMTDKKPYYFLSASAIGYYGMDTGDQLVDEKTSAGDDFLAEVTKRWEAEVDKIEQLDIAVGKIRIGIVLAEDGGALPQLAQPIKFYAGAPLGSGQQWMSWIHMTDLCRIFLFMLNSKSEHVFNGVSPNPVTNKEMTKAVAKALGKPIILPNVPAFVLKVLLGEMAKMLLGGNKVSANKIIDEGFEFKFENISEALNEVYDNFDNN